MFGWKIEKKAIKPSKKLFINTMVPRVGWYGMEDKSWLFTRPDGNELSPTDRFMAVNPLYRWILPTILSQRFSRSGFFSRANDPRAFFLIQALEQSIHFESKFMFELTNWSEGNLTNPEFIIWRSFPSRPRFIFILYYWVFFFFCVLD